MAGAVFLAAILPARVAAQTGAIPETPAVPGSAMLHMFFGLALVIGLLFLGAYLLRRLNGKAFGNTGPLRIVGGLMLSTRERIVLLEVGETWVVVGIVPGQIKTLYTLPKGELPIGKDAENRFSVWLKHVAERKNDGG
ncbi:MAG: flagellar biosynthetic protein FliO [Candidatus Accumulibacter sp.]|jgi:flagellar protein FliO/FliZ|nr:flagellar biosynthetic protein FliO [Accumulibacter sp.]